MYDNVYKSSSDNSLAAIKHTKCFITGTDTMMHTSFKSLRVNSLHETWNIRNVDTKL